MIALLPGEVKKISMGSCVAAALGSAGGRLQSMRVPRHHSSETLCAWPNSLSGLYVWHRAAQIRCRAGHFNSACM